MCLHYDLIPEALEMLKDNQHVAVVYFEKNGQPVVGWVADFRSTQAVSNVLRNLKDWHPLAQQSGLTANLDDVNFKRRQAGLFTIDENGLPAATGRAPPSSAFDIWAKKHMGENLWAHFEERDAQEKKRHGVAA